MSRNCDVGFIKQIFRNNFGNIWLCRLRADSSTIYAVFVKTDSISESRIEYFAERPIAFLYLDSKSV
jgi:hypothetical protein